jgi:hypothetical protein
MKGVKMEPLLVFLLHPLVIGNDAAFVASQEALFGYGSIGVGLEMYDSFSGSFQEIRYYSEPIR